MQPGLLVLFLLCQSPFPHRMEGYDFQTSLPSAQKAAGGKRPILIYSVPTVGLRDRLGHCERERLFFSRKDTKALLSGLPILAVQPGKEPLDTLRLPRMGFALLDPDGRTLGKTVPMKEDPRQVLRELAEALGRKLPDRDGEALSFMEARRRYRDARRRLETLLAGDKPVDSLIEEEEKRMPGSFFLRRLKEIRETERRGSAPGTGTPGNRPILDLCCVVADFPGFLEALKAWGRGPIFPILFPDAKFLPLFLEAYAPEKILLLRRKKRRTDRTPAMLLSAWARALGHEENPRTVPEGLALWRRTQERAPGLVLSHPASPMLAAGLALAAGRRQALVLEAPRGDPRTLAEVGVLLEVRERLRETLSEAGIRAFGLRDELDFVTLATELPHRYRDRKYADRTPYAFDDALCRDAWDFRWAFTGRLTGGREQALYQAMCALFLEPRKVLLFSRYDRRRLPWKDYDTASMAEELSKEYEIREISHPDATLERWKALFEKGPSPFGLVHVNSSGGSRNWSTSKGNGSFDDIPETVPAIVSYVHSNSAADPYDPDTVAGRWIANGAYVFFGSTSEPYLDAFLPFPQVLRKALDQGQPLSQAFRCPTGRQRWRPWKLLFVGDALASLNPRGGERRQASEPPMKDTVPLSRAAQKNPFGLQGADRKLFGVLTALLQGKVDAGGREIRTLLRNLSRKPGKWSPGQSSELADLCSLLLAGDPGGDRLSGLIPGLRKTRLSSQNLAYRLHYLARCLLPAALQETKKGRLESLLLLQLGMPFSPVMLRRIAEVYKRAFRALPQAGKRKKSLLAEIEKRFPGDLRRLRPFLKDFR